MLRSVCGWPPRATPSFLSAPTKRRLRGCSVQSMPTETFRCYHFDLADALAQLGRFDEARSAVQGGTGVQSDFHRFMLSHRCMERQSHLSCWARTNLRGPAQRWAAGGMIETRKIAAILSADLVGCSLEQMSARGAICRFPVDVELH